ncbi:hypothetical protein [Paraflavitalea pollutisoli]|uniref:hypothetical protein n=1 Tax=Paraflavitalea pollutisoli TaxID=3034143 RepID=UPI0023EB8DD9|nr:hypothetical protein [Paraflavitalea sp. H1-2-19X]
MSIRFKGNEEAIGWLLRDFLNYLEFGPTSDPPHSQHDIIQTFIRNNVKNEEGMDDFHLDMQEVDRKNKRMLRAIKSVKGRSFYNHVREYLKNIEAVYWREYEIVREPQGDPQQVSEYGRAIKKEWIDQWSTGTEGDSFDGYACIELKPGRYLRIYYSM